MRTLNCKGTLLDLSKPKVMGIINVTPDSFYDGGKTTNETQILRQAKRMLEEGASILDIGGYSSRPGASNISEGDETARIIPAIDAILKEFPKTIISVDTFRSQVAKNAISAGASIINDISAGSMDDNMFSTVSELKVPFIMMHMRGSPQTMTEHTDYENITSDVLRYFSEKIALTRQFGINDIICDPGFGFAKTRDQNFELLGKLELFQQLDLPVLVGISRKSLIYKTLKTTVENALNGTSVLNTVSLLKGASILRVHDVGEAMECITLTQNLANDG